MNKNSKRGYIWNGLQWALLTFEFIILFLTEWKELWAYLTFCGVILCGLVAFYYHYKAIKLRKQITK